MKIVRMNRGEGKTTYLIKKSAELQYPIICCSGKQKELIKDKAKKMGLDFPEPISINSINFKESLRGINYNTELLIDDLDIILHKILYNKVNIATVSCDVITDVNEDEVI